MDVFDPPVIARCQLNKIRYVQEIRAVHRARATTKFSGLGRGRVLGGGVPGVDGGWRAYSTAVDSSSTAGAPSGGRSIE